MGEGFAAMSPAATRMMGVAGSAVCLACLLVLSIPLGLVVLNLEANPRLYDEWPGYALGFAAAAAALPFNLFAAVAARRGPLAVAVSGAALLAFIVVRLILG
jgi:hypothetical protein